MEPFIAQVQLTARTFAPRGWAFCEGQLLPVYQNSALFSLIGTMYGGDGRSTFALPDLPEVTAKNGTKLRYIIALQGIFPSRS